MAMISVQSATTNQRLMISTLVNVLQLVLLENNEFDPRRKLTLVAKIGISVYQDHDGRQKHGDEIKKMPLRVKDL